MEVEARRMEEELKFIKGAKEAEAEKKAQQK